MTAFKAHKLLDGFEKATSKNLPVVDVHTLTEYIKKDTNFISPEIRNVKSVRNGRESYGDSAIGYVQLKRSSDGCIVIAAISPEHNVRNSSYRVEVDVDLKNSVVKSVNCLDCVASRGGCKHGLAVLVWLHRKSEIKGVTEVEAYWKKSTLSKVGTTLKYVDAASLAPSYLKRGIPYNKKFVKTSPQGSFLNEVRELIQENGGKDTVNECLSKSTIAYHIVDEKRWYDDIDLHSLALQFRKTDKTDVLDFLNFCQSKISEKLCLEAKASSIHQSQSHLWFKLRFCGITASKLHEAAHCNTTDGCLVNSIFGAQKRVDTKAMKRGRELEHSVVKEVEKKTRLIFKKTGLILSREHPIFGASPDGLNDDFVLEIKCPFTSKNRVNYIDEQGNLTEKCRAQIQLQMLFAKKNAGYFCIADHDFETSKKIDLILVNYDEKYTRNLVTKALEFWKKSIWPILFNL